MKIRNFIGAAVIAMAFMLAPAPVESAAGRVLELACAANAPPNPGFIDTREFTLPGDIANLLFFVEVCRIADGHIVIL